MLAKSSAVGLVYRCRHVELRARAAGSRRQGTIAAGADESVRGHRAARGRRSTTSPPPVAGAGEVVVDVERVGVCGTDVEFFTGEMAYLHQGHAAYPLRLGHEWCGAVSAVGAGVDPGWLGRRVTGDTMLGCGRCGRCRPGGTHVCADRCEIGIRGGLPGALAEQLAVPVTRPARAARRRRRRGRRAGRAGRQRAARGRGRAALRAGDRLLVLGPGRSACWSRGSRAAQGAEVHLLGLTRRARSSFAAGLGFAGAWTRPTLPAAAVGRGASTPRTRPACPALALDLVEPGKRVVYIGLAGQPSAIDTRTLALKDVTAVGILGGSAGLAGDHRAVRRGARRPALVVAATVGLDGVGRVLAGWRPESAGAGPKVHIDPRR